MRAPVQSLFVFALCAAGLCAGTYVAWAGQPAASDVTQVSAKQGAPRDDQPLSDLARQVLHRRMQRHGSDMSELNMAAILLRYDDVAAAATRIATEPRLLKPTAQSSDEELNASIPARFYVLQDELRDKAQALATAARTKDSTRLASAYGRLETTCINCHASFLPPNAGTDK